MCSPKAFALKAISAVPLQAHNFTFSQRCFLFPPHHPPTHPPTTLRPNEQKHFGESAVKLSKNIKWVTSASSRLSGPGEDHHVSAVAVRGGFFPVITH